MLVATPAVFFALGVSRLLVLAVPAAVIGSYSVAIHTFSQTLVAVLLVAMAAFRTADGGQRAAARTAMAVALGAFAAFGAAPVLGAVVDGAVGGLQLLAGHGGHAFADEQGAWAILPAFQVGLFTALWLAVAGGGQSWRCALAGLSGLVVVQALVGIPVDELAHHYGFDPHVGLVPRLGPGAAHGGGLVPHPSGAVHRARAGSAPRTSGRGVRLLVTGGLLGCGRCLDSWTDRTVTGHGEQAPIGSRASRSGSCRRFADGR